MIAALLLLATPPLELSLRAQRTTFHPGEPIALQVTLKNKTKSSLRVVPMLDGVGRLRSPSTYLVSKTAEGWRAVRLTVGICGNTNPLRVEDFLSLDAGKSLELLGPKSYYPGTMTTLSEPGTHIIKFVYDTTAPLDDWIGGPLPSDDHRARVAEVQPLYNEVPKGVFESNVIRITVRATP